MTVVDDAPIELARFAVHHEWFVCGEHAGLACVRAWAPAERLVEHYAALLTHLGSPRDRTVDMFVREERTGRRWAGARCEVSAVIDAVSRARLTLAAFGGVELSVTTATDQMVLTPELLLVVYATTPRWPYLLEARGLMPRASCPAPQWHAPQAGRAAAPALLHALEQLATRLSLVEVHA